MSLCSSCGEEVRWAKRDNGRNHPPLVYIGQVLIVGADNVVREVAGYRQHICDPGDIESWTAYRNPQTEQRIDYQDTVKRANEAARVVECTRCGSDVDVPCKNLHERKKGNAVDTVWPHPERLQAVGWETVGPKE